MIGTYDVVIVGGGFCGTMTAVHLARAGGAVRRIALIDRSPAPGRGVAYGTPDLRHLLNVRASGMSAFPDDPDHFTRWLTAHAGRLAMDGVTAIAPDDFVPRRVYGDYVQDILRETRLHHPGLTVLRADVTGIAPSESGYDVIAQGKVVAAGRRVVLAPGNFPPGGGGLSSANPYAPDVLERIIQPGDVFLIGTGLTSLDLIVTMAERKREGKIHVLSRGGLFPQTHKAVRRYGAFLDAAALPETALGLLSAIRREIRAAMAQGQDWQNVIDAMRPLNQALWQALPPAEQRKFLRRIRPFWDTHRHRAAPEIAAARLKLEAQGRLIAHRGAFLSMRETDHGVDVAWMPAGGTVPRITDVRHAVSCTGPQADVRKLNDPLVANLLKRDLIAPDGLRLGVDTDGDGGLRNSRGATVPNLYTLGSWRKGSLYESVAVPELREQALALAEILGRQGI